MIISLRTANDDTNILYANASERYKHHVQHRWDPSGHPRPTRPGVSCLYPIEWENFATPLQPSTSFNGHPHSGNQVLQLTAVIVMAPPGEIPDRGWPMILYAHRGGWVLGDTGAEDKMLSKLCVDAQCVTVSVDYRLAPEHPFPAGLDDVWDALNWLSKGGERELGIDPKRIAIMGGSAGGNLAAVITQCASLTSPRIPLVYQALITPVIDASFSANDRSWWTPSMTEHEDNWDLTVLEMLRFRDLYLPNVHDRTKPNASPCYQENRLTFEGMPPTWISIAEVDTLRSGGETYAEKLRTYGVSITLKILKGLPHTGIKCDRVCGQVRKHHDELAKSLQKAFA
ncbi:hypothetical protein RSAG8_12416, partial [Rhizoctonia solani AG-8 WAC10335]